MSVQIATNMKCGSCLNKLRPRLDHAPGIRRWSSNLEDPRKLLLVDLDPTTDPDDIVQLVRGEGFEANLVQADSSPAADKPAETSKPAFQLSTYKPLFLVVTYVLGATLLMLRASGTWDWSLGMSYFMGFFFLGFAFFKLLDISKFADAFATYDVVAKHSRAYALAYPWLEVGLGVLFVTGSYLYAANILTVVAMSVGLVGVVSAVRKKQAIQCACLGTVFNLPMSVVTIVENSLMIAMALAALAEAALT